MNYPSQAPWGGRGREGHYSGAQSVFSVLRVGLIRRGGGVMDERTQKNEHSVGLEGS